MSIVIPASIEDRKAIKTAIDQISECLTSINSEKAQVNEIIKAVEEKYQLPKKVFRKLAYMHFKQTIASTVEETSEIEELYTKLFKS